MDTVNKNYVSSGNKLNLKAMIKIIPVYFGSPFSGLPANPSIEKIHANDFHPKYLLNNENMSDVTFVVGEEKVEYFCQSSFMATASPVFYRKLFPSKDSKFKGTRDYQLPDVHPSAFETIPRFIHRKEVVVQRNMIEPLLNAVEKYDIKFLYRILYAKSLTYLVNPKTVISFFPFVADKVGEEHFLWDKV